MTLRIARSRAHATALRQGGLRVTSTRLVILQLAPQIIAEHGHVTPQLLYASVLRRGGYTFSLSTFYNALPRLICAGLVPDVPANPACRTRSLPQTHTRDPRPCKHP